MDCARLGGHWRDVENSNGSSCKNSQHHKQACKPTVHRPIEDILGVVMAEQGLVHWITQTYSTKPLHYITVFYPDNVHFGLFSHLTKHQKNWKPQGKGCSRLPGTQKRPTAAIQKRPLHLAAKRPSPHHQRHQYKRRLHQVRSWHIESLGRKSSSGPTTRNHNPTKMSRSWVLLCCWCCCGTSYIPFVSGIACLYIIYPCGSLWD